MAIVGVAMVVLGSQIAPFGFISIGFCAVGLSFVAAAVPRLLNYYFGLRGENRTARTLEVLPDDYTAIANWTNSCSKSGDTDVIVVGPTSVIALEIKTWTFSVLLKNDKCYQVLDNGYHRAIKSPITQATRNAKSVAKKLKCAGIEAEVLPMVVFNNKADLKVVDCSIQVCKVMDLVASIKRAEETCPTDHERVIQVLTSQP